MNKFKRLLKTLLIAPLFMSACVMNNGLCMCENKVDANNDGLCDNCGKQIEGLCVHEDKDGDLVCDICGEDLIDPHHHEKQVKDYGEITTPESIKVGETLLPEQVSVVVNYDDDTSETLHPSLVSLDTSAAGSIGGTLVINETTLQFTMNVVQEAAVVLSSIGQVSAPTQILKGGELSVEQITVVASYSDGSTEIVHPESISLDTSIPGSISGTLSYKGKSTTFIIEVVEDETPIVTVVGLGTVYVQSSISQNETLNKEDVNVVVYYSNNDSGIVHPENINLNTSSVGEVSGSVSYGGFSASFTIQVVSPIKNLKVTSLPESIEQYATLSVNDISIEVTYKNDSKETKHPESIELDTSIIGLATGSYKLLGKEGYFTIRVIGSGKTIVSLTNISAPASIEKGETLSISDVTFTINYYDGTTAVAHPDSIDLDTSSEGSKTGTIHYKGVTATFSINVIYTKVLTGIASVSAPSSVKQNATLSVNEVTVYLTYSDGSNGSAHPETISLNTSVAGNVVGIATYGGFQKSFSITVVAVEQVNVYLVLTSVGLYEGHAGNDFDELFLENAVIYTGAPGTALPGKDKVTHKYGNCDFDAWLSYEGTGFPNVYANVPFEDNKILYASFVENGQDPVTPPDPTIPDDPTETETYYLRTSFSGGDWDIFGEQVMYAYCWNSNPNDSHGYKMTWDHDRDWKVELPKDKYTMVIFCRMEPTTEIFNWDQKLNQTIDLAFESGKHIAQIQGWGAGYGANCPVAWIA